jgi:two-component system OmpR family response regulator
VTPRAWSKPTVLVVDSDHHVLDTLTVILKSQGFVVDTAASGPLALNRARKLRPDAVILEVALGGFDGFELLRRLRAYGIDAPGLFLTSRITLQDKLIGLAVGGDDYITKPFSPEEVLARLQAILRRSQHDVSGLRATQLRCADVVVNEDSHEVCKAGEPVTLTPTQFEVLRYLMINTGTVLSKPNILDHVWHHDGRDVNVVESCVCQLRRKVDTGDMRLIHTVRGFVYVLREPRPIGMSRM